MQPPAVPLSPLEEAMLLWDHVSAPWTIHVELRAPTLDLPLLRRAWAAATERHEAARWSLVPGAGRRWREAPTPPPIEVVTCPDDAALSALRDRLANEVLDPAAPSFATAVVARGPGGDRLLVRLRHVVVDGLGTVRFLQSVARAYRGLPDPAPPLDARSARRAVSGASRWDLTQLTARWSAGLEVAAGALQPRVRVARQGGGLPGAGATSIVLDATAVDTARQVAGASFDEHLVASLHLAIDRWNRRHGGPPGAISVAFGVNLRPAAWPRDVVANLVSYVSSTTSPEDRSDPAALVGRVRSHLDPERRARWTTAVEDGSRWWRTMPFDARRRMLAAVPEDRYDSVAASNLGVLEEVPTLGAGDDAFVILGSAEPSIGLTVVAYTIGERLHLTAGFRRERFDEDGVLAFLDELATALTAR